MNKWMQAYFLKVIFHPQPYLNGGEAKLQAKLWYGWIITSHCLHEGYYLCPNPEAAVIVCMAIIILIHRINSLRPNDAYMRQ